MSWLKALLAVYKIAQWIVRFLERQRWISEGRAQVYRESLEKAHELAKRARDAESNLSHDSDSVQNDPNNRDRN